MKSTASLAGIILVALFVGVAPPPAAWSAPGPTCTFSADIVLDPGLSSDPSSGTFETAPGRDGTYKCQGPFDSEKSGAAGTSGRYGTSDRDSCADGGEGEGALRLGGGSGGGDEAAYTFTYSPFSEDGVSKGRFHSDRFEVTFTLTAQNGDCDIARVTRARLEGEGTVRP